MPLRLRTAIASETGDFRDVNQDAAFAAPWGAAVADGVGGGPAGDLAASALLHRLVAGGPAVADADALAVRIREANWDLAAHVRRDPALAGMATTLTAVWLSRGGALLLAHTGDSRAYLSRDGRLSRQTRDDSFVQVLVEHGLVRAEDAMTHPRRNIITASLRGDEGDRVRVREEAPQRGDRWLLCSDGVSDYLPDDALEALLDSTPYVESAARRIVATALEAGSRDNVTAIVCDVVDAADIAAPADPFSARPVFGGAAATRFAEDVDELAG